MRRTYLKSIFVPPQSRLRSNAGQTGGRKEVKGRNLSSSVKGEGEKRPATKPGGFMNGIRIKGAE